MNNEDFKETVLPSWVKKLLEFVGFFFCFSFYEEFYEPEEFLSRVRLHRVLKGKSFRDFEFVRTGYDDIFHIKINSEYHIMVWEDGHYSVHTLGLEGKCIIVRSIGGLYSRKIDRDIFAMVNNMIKERNIEICLPNYQSLKKPI